MNAILFNNYINNIHGAVIDLVEYYLSILEFNKDFKLLIINYNSIFQKELISIIKERYYLDDLDWEINIISIKKKDLLKFKFNKLLILDYGTINAVQGLINIKDNKSKIFILSDLHTEDKKYLINKNLYPEGCVNYYGEMPFVYKDFQYNMKFLFDRYKPLRKSDDKFFIHSPESDDYSFLKEWGISKKQCIFKTHKHKNNLFELFDIFWYYHAAKWWDPRPRLMHESYFYEKNIIYNNIPIWKDGSYYRNIDLNMNGLKNRYLNKDDEIVRQFI